MSAEIQASNKPNKIVNYYYELNKFYTEYLPLNKLTANQIALYHAILYIANKANKITDLSIPLLIFKQYTGLEKDAILYARKMLQNKGLITFQQSIGCNATKYSLKTFSAPKIKDNKDKEKKSKIKNKKSKANNFKSREYTDEQLNNVYSNLENITF